MAYTDPTKDVDVSGQMEHGGVVEIGLTMMWYKALKDKCVHRDGSRALVVDVGGNFGWYSIYAATLGCRSAFCSELSFEFCVGDQGKLLIACTILATPCLHANAEHMHKLGDRPSCCHNHVSQSRKPTEVFEHPMCKLKKRRVKCMCLLPIGSHKLRPLGPKSFAHWVP